MEANPRSIDRLFNSQLRYETAMPSALPCTDMRRILLDFDVSTALPLLLYLELDAELTAQQTTDCLLVLESFIARRVFTGLETKEYNKLFVEIIGSLRSVTGDQVRYALCKKLLSGGGATRHWPTDAEIIEAAISRPAYNALKTSALRLILERIEVIQRGKKSESLDMPTGLQIEHVLPERWAEHWPLEGKTIPADVVMLPYRAKDDLADFAEPIRARNAQLHTLGNLTLLNKYLNPAASNGSFDMKQVEYKHSVLRLNRYFDGRTSWAEESINQRGKVLGELLCKVWPRSTESS